MAANLRKYTIISWNVNGYSDDIHKWLLTLAQTHRPDVIFLSETKKKREQLLQLFQAFTEYTSIINSHNPAKWHGVAMLIRKDHTYQEVSISMNIPVRKDCHDKEAATGRVIVIHLNQEMYVVGSYTPNSGRSDPDKLVYRTEVWDPAFAHILDILKSSGPTVWIGDINVALDDIDVSNPKAMKKYAGFTLEERENLRKLLGTGDWIDIWRQQNPNEPLYTWRSYASGMRLDNIIVSKSLLPSMLNAFSITGSPTSADHIPIGVYIARR